MRKSEEGAIAPGLLVAMPQLEDPNFHRSVVLMVRHASEGSFGIIVNRPSEVGVVDILASLEVEWAGSSDAVVWTGGPVMPHTALLLHQPVTEPCPDGTIEVSAGIALSTTPERLHDLATEPPRRLRLLMGYAGWGSGQLEWELAQGAWLLAPPDPDLIFDAPPDEMWTQVLHSLGIEPAALVPGPGVH